MSGSETQRCRRLFGSLLGTLHRFQQDETALKAREERKRQIERRIEQRTQKESDEINAQRSKSNQERRAKHTRHLIQQVQSRRKASFEAWEQSMILQKGHIRTSINNEEERSSRVVAELFYLPLVHNESTREKLERSVARIDEEIEMGRTRLQSDLERIEQRFNSRLDNEKPTVEVDDEDCDEDDDAMGGAEDNEDNLDDEPSCQPRSSVVLVQRNEAKENERSTNQQYVKKEEEQDFEPNLKMEAFSGKRRGDSHVSLPDLKVRVVLNADNSGKVKRHVKREK